MKRHPTPDISKPTEGLTAEQLADRFIDDWMCIPEIDIDGRPVAAANYHFFRNALVRYLKDWKGDVA